MRQPAQPTVILTAGGLNGSRTKAAEEAAHVAAVSVQETGGTTGTGTETGAGRVVVSNVGSVTGRVTAAGTGTESVTGTEAATGNGREAATGTGTRAATGTGTGAATGTEAATGTGTPTVAARVAESMTMAWAGTEQGPHRQGRR